MVGPTVLLVSETPSLADALRLFLETLGYSTVAEEDPGAAVARVSVAGSAGVDAVVVVCNQSRSEFLERYRHGSRDRAGTLPVVVVGDPRLEEEGGWPTTVRFVALPLDVAELGRALEDAAFPPVAPPAPSSVGIAP